MNLSTAIYLGVFSRAEQRVLQAIFKAIAEGGGRCVATLATLPSDSNTSKSTTRNAIAQGSLLAFFGQRPAFFGQTQAGERLGDQRKATREVIAGTAIEPHLPAAFAGRCGSHRA
jgi:hypothetical protein